MIKNTRGLRRGSTEVLTLEKILKYLIYLLLRRICLWPVFLNDYAMERLFFTLQLSSVWTVSMPTW